jgi:hypothetical protein
MLKTYKNFHSLPIAIFKLRKKNKFTDRGIVYPYAKYVEKSTDPYNSYIFVRYVEIFRDPYSIYLC